MRSRTSYFNKTVFWSDCAHFWPLTAGYALILLLVLPLSFLTRLNYDGMQSAWDMRYDVLNFAAHGGYLFAFVSGILFAMAAFAYLTNPRATNGLHALSARRETLYVTHYLAGLCSQLATQLLAVLLTAAVLAAHRAFDARTVGLMLLAFALPTLFFYSFGVLCMMFTGQILAAPVFYGVLNFLVVGVEMLLRTFAGIFLYGWAGDNTPGLTVFSPITKLVQNGVLARLIHQSTADGAGVSPRVTGIVLDGLDWLLIYAAVGLVFAALGLLVYRARHSEATGSTVAIGWARPIFKYGVAYCAALSLGLLLYYLFFGQHLSHDEYSLPGMLLCMAAAGLIGYFLAEMLLKKSFRVFRSGWRGAAVVAATLAALGFALTFDFTGYENRVPAADQIESVEIGFHVYHNGGGSGFDAIVRDEETIALVAEAHRAVARDKQHQLSDDYYRSRVGQNGGTLTPGWLYVNYSLKNGQTVSRRYSSLTLYSGDAHEGATPTAALTALYNARGIAIQRALGRAERNWGLAGDPRTLEELRFTGGHISLDTPWQPDGSEPERLDYELSAADAKLVFDALLRDAEAGRLSDSLFAEEKSMPGYAELYGTCRDANDSRVSRTVADADGNGRVYVYFHPVFTPSMTDTLAVLGELGIELAFY